MKIPQTSRQYLTVPVAELMGARPGVDLVDLAVIPDNGSEPGPGDWHGAMWLTQAGVMLGPAVLIGPGGYGAWQLPPGTYRIWVCENLPATAPVWAWERLTIGTG